MTKKSWQKLKYFENEKSIYIIFKGFSIKQIAQQISEGESSTLSFKYLLLLRSWRLPIFMSLEFKRYL